MWRAGLAAIRPFALLCGRPADATNRHANTGLDRPFFQDQKSLIRRTTHTARKRKKTQSSSRTSQIPAKLKKPHFQEKQSTTDFRNHFVANQNLSELILSRYTDGLKKIHFDRRQCSAKVCRPRCTNINDTSPCFAHHTKKSWLTRLHFRYKERRWRSLSLGERINNCFLGWPSLSREPPAYGCQFCPAVTSARKHSLHIVPWAIVVLLH